MTLPPFVSFLFVSFFGLHDTIYGLAVLFTAKRYDVEGNLFEIITSDETRYFLQAASADEKKEWIQAIQAVSKTGK